VRFTGLRSSVRWRILRNIGGGCIGYWGRGEWRIRTEFGWRKPGKWLFALALFEQVIGDWMPGEEGAGFLRPFEDTRILAEIRHVGVNSDSRKMLSFF
jgi:hypothetical protein